MKFPGSKGNLDHVVIGPNGVFVIETKNLSGFFVINDKEWLFKKHVLLNVPLKRSLSQPGKQVMANAKDLRKFLKSNGINVNDLRINSIVTIIKNNYKIKKKPKNYDIINSSLITEFILNREKQVDPKLLNEIALTIEPYCNLLVFGHSQIMENHNNRNENIDSFDLNDDIIKSEDNSQVDIDNNSKPSNDTIKVEFTVKECLKQLPKDYLIFTNVKIPRNPESLGHIVIGPNGIFVLKTKNYEGFYIIQDDEWFYKSSKSISKAHIQPGKQVMVNTMSLRNFLRDNSVDMGGVWVNSIVTLKNNNFKIEKKPKRYNVVSPSKLTEYILNYNGHIDKNIIIESALLLNCISDCYRKLE